jgi:hypothetical protein
MIEFANQHQLTNHTLQIAKSFQFPLSTYLIRPYTSRFDLKHRIMWIISPIWIINGATCLAHNTHVANRQINPSIRMELILGIKGLMIRTNKRIYFE